MQREIGMSVDFSLELILTASMPWFLFFWLFQDSQGSQRLPCTDLFRGGIIDST